MESNINDLVKGYEILKKQLAAVNKEINERANELKEFYIGKSVIVNTIHGVEWLYNVHDFEIDNDLYIFFGEVCYCIYVKDIETGYDSYDVEYHIKPNAPYIRNTNLYKYNSDNKYELLMQTVKVLSNEEFVEKLVKETGLEEFKNLPILFRDKIFKTY